MEERTAAKFKLLVSSLAYGRWMLLAEEERGGLCGYIELRCLCCEVGATREIYNVDRKF